MTEHLVDKLCVCCVCNCTLAQHVRDETTLRRAALLMKAERLQREWT